MEKLSENKFQTLSKDEMANLQGGGFWNKWKSETLNGVSYDQRYNWFGLHATGDLDNVEAD